VALAAGVADAPVAGVDVAPLDDGAVDGAWVGAAMLTVAGVGELAPPPPPQATIIVALPIIASP
jgi:hypothetical protein